MRENQYNVLTGGCVLRIGVEDSLDCAASTDELNEQHNQSDDQQDVYVSSEDVEANKS